MAEIYPFYYTVYNSLRALAIDFILDGNYSYYERLKDTYKPEDWSDFYPWIIALLEEHGQNSKGVYTSILVAEKEKQKLL